MTAQQDLVAEAIELATLALGLRDGVVSTVEVAERVVAQLAEHGAGALSAQASLTLSIAAQAEAAVTRVLASPQLLARAAILAEAGKPISAELVGVTKRQLLQQAGAALATLRS